MAEGPARTVLVVDDEPHLRVFLAAVFRSAGFRTVTAASGAEGLARAREARPDLVSLDLMMPGQGGLVMYRGLREDPELRDGPVLIVSAVPPKIFGHSLAMLRATLPDGLKAPEAYVEKPPTPEALLEAAKGLLSGAGTGAGG